MTYIILPIYVIVLLAVRICFVYPCRIICSMLPRQDINELNELNEAIARVPIRKVFVNE